MSEEKKVSIILKARDIMTKEVITVGPDITLAEAIKILVEKKISGMPVINTSGEIVGILSEKDILNFAFGRNPQNIRVMEAMTKNVLSFPPDAAVALIASAIASRRFRRVPIVEAGKVVGIISRRDIMKSVFQVG